MNRVFVTHLDHVNQFSVTEARPSLYIICAIFFFLVLISFVINKEKPLANPGSLISFETSQMLKGLAIFLLFLGHFSQQCTTGAVALPFRITGNAAVITFLFLSGLGLAKRYNLEVTKGFWINRIRRIAFPYWISLSLFLILNSVFIAKTVPLYQILLNYFGIFWPGIPNSPCWFITYILFLYAVYFVACRISKPKPIKIAIMFLLPFLASILILSSGLKDYFHVWIQYSFVFPIGVLCGVESRRIKEFIDQFMDVTILGYVGCTLAFVVHYWTGLGVYRISHLFGENFFTPILSALINPISLIISLILMVGIIERLRVKSNLLAYFGRYSYELYLLHFPFMVYYDFLLFRRPLVLFFFVYVACMIILGILLRKGSTSG